MKTLAPKVAVVEVDGEGFAALLGKDVEVQTPNFIFAGKLEGENDTFIKLSNSHVVFDTGAYKNAKYTYAEKRSTDALYIQKAAIIAYCETTQLK